MKKKLIVGLLIILFLNSCAEKDIDEFSGLINIDGGDPLAFLDAEEIGEIDQTNPDEVRNLGLVTFSNEYTDIKEWGKLKFAQKGKEITQIEENSLLDVLAISRKGGKQMSFLPIDTQIGPLMDYKDISFVDTKIYELIDKFFLLMKVQELDKQLRNLVVSEEIPIISRQILRSSEYAAGITDVRVGKIKTVDVNKRSAAVRVITRKHDVSTRTKVKFYFLNTEGEWMINALEGDLDRLSENYELPGEFSPQGTTGVTQGF